MIGHRAFAVSLMLPCASCGLASHDAGSAPVPSDGISGFGPAAPVELCVGSARVVSPSSSSGSEVAALCVAEGSAPRACALDSECEGIEHCVCGRCTVQACGGGGSCRASEVCRSKRCTRPCTTDAGCAAGERCVAGGCARSCATDTACHYGERCDPLDGACAAQSCGVGEACGSGDACEPQELVGEVHEPEIAASLPSLAFVEIRQGGVGSVYRVRIDAPTRWVADPSEPVLVDSAAGIGGVSALVHGGRIDLYAALGDGSAIVHASSTDEGRTFARDAEPVLEPALSWQEGRVTSPALFEWGGKTYLLYEGGQGAGIGLSEIRGGRAELLSDAPIASPATIDDPVFWRGVTEVGSPFAIVAGDVVRVYFTGRGAEGSDALTPQGTLPADINDSIGLLTSVDLRRFDRFPVGPVFAGVANLRAYLGEREPSLRLLSPGAELYFVAADASGQNVAGLALATR